MVIGGCNVVFMPIGFHQAKLPLLSDQYVEISVSRAFFLKSQALKAERKAEKLKKAKEI